MLWLKACALFLLLVDNVLCIIDKKEQTSYIKPNSLASMHDDCDPSTIPVMASFDMKKFSGKWFELAKTATGYIDVSDGVWLIEGSPVSNNFRFSGRDNNQHCIRPLKGQITAAQEPPGMLTLSYQTYSTHVKETIRVLFTDYTSVAVIYACVHHVHHEKELCHAAGLFGAVWTRKPHVDVEVYDKAVQYLEMACIQKNTLMIRNVVGPCRIENLDYRIDDFPAPDYCYQLKDLGSCSGSIQRYYFDPKEKDCKLFSYGGCGGNKNNFMSRSECQKKCVSTANKDPVCMSVAKCALHCSPCCTEDETGCVECSCEHIIEDKFLNCIKNPSDCPRECKTKEMYPGCQVCMCNEENKKDIIEDVCNEVKSLGNCMGLKSERYFYNSAVDKCEKFIFMGCDGNNNFKTLQECNEKCQKSSINDHPTVQRMPIDNPNGSSRNNYGLWIIALFAVILPNLRFIH